MKELYYSYSLAGKIPDSKYQLVFKNRTELLITTNLLNDLFIFNLWKCDIVEVEKYLEYHYNKYNGDKTDFLTYTDYLIKFKIKVDEDMAEQIKNFSLIKGAKWRVKLKAELCFKWIEKKAGLAPKKVNDNYKDKIWFKVGLLFAIGEMQKLLKKHNNNSTHVAKELGNQSYRPYISDTNGDSAKGNKNIYSSQEKLQQIQTHCLENKIPMSDAFLKHIKPTET